MVSSMTWWEAALWGGFGGLAVELVQFLGAIHRHRKWPWQVAGEVPADILLVSALVRVLLGCGLAAAANQTGQFTGPLGAVVVGVAAPLLVEQMAKRAAFGQPEGEKDAS